MSHPDPETRVGAHSIFSVVLMPSALSPLVDEKMKTSGAVSGFSSVSSLQKNRGGSFSSQDESEDNVEPVDVGTKVEGSQISDPCMKQYHQSYSFKSAMTGGRIVRNFNSIFQQYCQVHIVL